MLKQNPINELSEYVDNAKQSFRFFLKYIFPRSYKKGTVVKSPHTYKWADRLQNNKRTATLSARKHLKSTTIYAFIMWRLFKLSSNERWNYMSYNQDMSVYHTKNIKELIEFNPFFSDLVDNSYGSSMINYSKHGVRFVCEPNGILKFNRGWHGDGVICDDILQDPTSEMLFTSIDKINRVFMEQVMSLPIEGGEIHLVGTAQHTQDLFFKILDMVKDDRKDNRKESWNWAEYKGLLNESNKEVLWPELFSYDRLCELRREIGEKAFNKEYQCSPVWSEDAYFKRDELMLVVNSVEEKRPAGEWKAGRIVAGLDIGKKAHPSHFAIFEERRGHFRQIYQCFFDGWDYTKQIEFINGQIKHYLIDTVNYDATRGEFESFVEQNLISNKIYKPIIFGTKVKFAMASNFSKHVNNKSIRLLNSQRMIDSILSVNNNLQAPETDIGHGDAFWSVAMAVYETPMGGGYMAG